MPQGTATVELLLCTTAGINGWASGYVELGSPSKALDKVIVMPPSPPETPVMNRKNLHP